MRVLVNALSGTNQSGHHILRGQLPRLANWTLGEHEYVVLYPTRNQACVQDLGPNVRWVKCPSLTAHWLSRWLWEYLVLSHKAVRFEADFVFTPAGVLTPGLRWPQVVLAPNPWCLVSNLPRGPGEQLKAALQRRAYKAAMKGAAVMVFISRYMHEAYRANAGFEAKAALVVYLAIGDATHAAARSLRSRVQRRSQQIVSVSAMAPHKGVETVLAALSILRDQFRIPAELVLVGGWPDRQYEHRIRRMVGELQLNELVRFAGRVTQAELHQYYAESAVFCLMSRCESFGIPAVEAQAFGTPVVSSNCCAIPEVCGKGGLYPEAGDVPDTAQALAKSLREPDVWRQLSDAAIENAAKYQWDLCTRPLLKMFDVVARTPQSPCRA